jgi:hypothetical protein
VLSRARVGAGLLAALAGIGSPAAAADLALPAAPAVAPMPPTGFEARFGLFDHGLGSPERNTLDVSGEIVLAKPALSSAFWTTLLPRPHFGGSFNTAGKTSFAYAGALWTFPVIERAFVEGYLDAAVHDGVLDGDATRSAMGCRLLFHAGASLGYRFDPRWSIMATYEHLSNGHQAIGNDCSRNQGLNNYGLRVGYSF